MSVRTLVLLLSTFVPQSHSENVECSLPLEQGMCRARIPRFFYNSESDRCELFFYGGCGGNENNFETLRACHDTCYPDKSITALTSHFKSPHCTSPPIESNAISCRAAFPKFTFNPSTGQCDRYLYGGCYGTNNLYSSADECESACLHKAQKKSSMSMFRARFGSLDDDNDEEDDDDDAILFPGFDEQGDICQLPPMEPGNRACLAYIEKWTFDARQQKCVKFIYGGCRGTENLFDSFNDCESRCGNVLKQASVQADNTALIPALCQDPPILPPPDFNAMCLAYIPKFTFDSTTGKCVSLIYGGCFGTQNLFDTETDCYKTCSPDNVPQPKTLDVCALPLKTGPCRAAISMFGFNKNSKRCERFTYGGCQGNDNKFSSVQECVNTCGGIEPQENELCSVADCDTQETRIYKAKGCQPIVLPGECCPSSWDCSSWNERLTRLDECFVANDEFPNGKYYSANSPMPEITQNCHLNCFCSSSGIDGEPAKPTCASVDCPQQWPSSGTNCKKLHDSIDGCCDFSFKCDDELEKLPTCLFENKTYVAGQKMYSDLKDCRVCHCKEGWTGEDSDEFCYNVDCFATSSHYLAKGCLPIFKSGVCCPVDWECEISDVSEDSIAAAAQNAPEFTPVMCPEGKRPLRNPEAVSPPLEPLSSFLDSVSLPASQLELSDVCLLPMPEGECEPFVDKWFFSQQTRTCVPFQYGSYISEGRNVFDTKQSCENLCNRYIVEERNSTRCEAANDITSAVDRCVPQNSFKYNSRTKRCENFVSLGCEHNKNSFKSVDECEAVCLSDDAGKSFPGKSSECNERVRPGPCRSRMKRFYYDESDGVCRQFWFSGCGENGNNFEDMNQCIQKCVPSDRVPRAIQSHQLELKNPCSQSQDPGPCRGSKPSWYFDSGTQTCKMFLYGGCQGNDNRFSSFSECLKTCSVDLEAQELLQLACSLPLSTGGMCRARLSRYFFNAATNECELFYYSGCEGNANNFASETECSLQCKFTRQLETVETVLSTVQSVAIAEEEADDVADNVCLLDKEVGFCRGFFPKFYFDRDEKVCKKFIYGGCMGNGNNFGTLGQCQQTCSKQNQIGARSGLEEEEEEEVPIDNSVCAQPMDSGPCKAARPFWFFNSTSNACERFFWGGCRGNLNRFATKEKCSATCAPVRTPRELVANTPPKCSHGNKNFNLGDFIRFNEDKCRVCTCNTPPDLTCRVKTCPTLPPMPRNSGKCFKKMDEDGCCAIAFRCLHDNPSCEYKQCRAIRLRSPNANEICTKTYGDDGCCLTGTECVPQKCPSKICKPILLNKPREDEICTSTYDQDNCCVVGQICKPKRCSAKPCPLIGLTEPKEGEVCVKKYDAEGCCVTGQKCIPKVCLGKPCPAIAFLPPDGKTCTETKDEHGCCVIGLDCV